jgi:hypothetical protein
MSLSRFSRISRRRFAAGTLGALAAGAVGSRAFAQATPEPAASPVAGDDMPLVRIEYTGGLRPMELYLLHAPSLLVYADGTVIQPAPVVAVYPPVAITPFNAFTVSKAAVDGLLEQAVAAGLDEPRDIINSLVMDASTAQITVVLDGKPVTSSVYALDANGPTPPEWDEETAQRFAAIQDFANAARTMATSLDADDIVSPEAPYVPARLEVIAFVPDPANPLPSGVPDLSAAALTWPLDRSLEEIGAVYGRAEQLSPAQMEMRCAEIGGDDAQAVIATAANGNFISPWQDGDQLYGLLINPLFPGDSGCQPVQA